MIGFVLEKVAGRAAGVGDLKACEEVLGKLHARGVVHGDVNRYNFLVGEGGVTIIDFEKAEEGASEEARRGELGGGGGGLCLVAMRYDIEVGEGGEIDAWRRSCLVVRHSRQTSRWVLYTEC